MIFLVCKYAIWQPSQGCQIIYFQTKNPKGKIWMALE
jgi:hypothetical protein